MKALAGVRNAASILTEIRGIGIATGDMLSNSWMWSWPRRFQISGALNDQDIVVVAEQIDFSDIADYVPPGGHGTRVAGAVLHLPGELGTGRLQAVARRQFEFEIVSEQEDGFVIVALEDVDLALFQQRLTDFIGTGNPFCTRASC